MKRLIIFAMVLTLLFSITACGDENNKENSATDSNVSSTNEDISSEENSVSSDVTESINQEVSSKDAQSSKPAGNQSQNSKPSNEQKPVNNQKETVLANAKAKADKQQYLEAMRILKEFLSSNPNESDVKEKLSQYTEKYVQQQISAAEVAFVSPTADYEKALNIIKGAIQNVPDSSILKTKKDYYQGFAPCYLSNMTPYDKTTWFDSLDSDKDIFGTTHKNCIAKDNLAQWANATYDLSAKYNTFTAIAYPRAASGENTDGYIKIYVDGECKYSKTDIPYNARPFEITLDVTGAMDIKIEYEWDSKFALAEARVQKTVK